MAKRPSKVSLRARQKNILEGLGTTDFKYAEAAKKFGVTPRQLKRFVETKPQDLRRNFNRSPAYEKLYGAASSSTEQRKEVRERLGVSRIKRYKYRERDIQNLKTLRLSEKELRNRTQIGEQLQNLYTKAVHARYDWASYTREHNLPRSIEAIKLLHRNNQISDDEYLTTIKVWRDIYTVSAARFERYADDVIDFGSDDGDDDA